VEVVLRGKIRNSKSLSYLAALPSPVGAEPAILAGDAATAVGRARGAARPAGGIWEEPPLKVVEACRDELCRIRGFSVRERRE
jgi:hypothetical protein